MKLEGIMPAIASPNDEQEVFQEDTFVRLMDTLFEADIQGLYICGSTGDGYKMRPAERKRATELAVANTKQRNAVVIAHVGSATNTREALDLAEHAAETGVTAIASIPPARCNQSQLVQYYTDIAKASQLPTLVYHIPAITGLNPTVEELTELLDIEGVAGLKFTDWCLILLRRVRLARPEAVIFSGFDEILCPGLMYGADGGIGSWYNVFPAVYVAIYKAVKSGDFERAMQVQMRLLDVLDLAWKYGVMQVFEQIIRREGFGPYCFRKPRQELDEGLFKKIEPELDRLLANLEELVENNSKA